MRLRHQAALYEGVDEFVAMTEPFVREGLEAGDPVIAVAPRPNADALREALGEDAAGVEIRYAEDWYLSPGRAFGNCMEFASAHADASCVRMLGEPILPVGWPAGIRAYAHYETVVNVIAGDAPFFVMCPYSIGSLPDEVIEHAKATHPELRRAGEVAPSPTFTDPDAFSAALLDAAPPLGRPRRRYPVTTDLGTLRRAVRADAKAAGALNARFEEFLIGLNEAMTNALLHGRGPAMLSTASDEHAFVCEVENSGPGISETTAGYVPFDPTREDGRGLWLMRQMCDLVEIRSREGTTAVRLHLRRN